jgi:hypothetical protein
VDFRHRDLPGVDKRVFRLGLAVNYGLGSDEELTWMRSFGEVVHG